MRSPYELFNHTSSHTGLFFPRLLRLSHRFGVVVAAPVRQIQACKHLALADAVFELSDQRVPEVVRKSLGGACPSSAMYCLRASRASIFRNEQIRFIMIDGLLQRASVRAKWTRLKSGSVFPT